MTAYGIADGEEVKDVTLDHGQTAAGPEPAWRAREGGDPVARRDGLVEPGLAASADVASSGAGLVGSSPKVTPLAGADRSSPTARPAIAAKAPTTTNAIFITSRPLQKWRQPSGERGASRPSSSTRVRPSLRSPRPRR